MTPSTVTWRSSMLSSSADCVFGLARLISSASTMFANTAPGLELEVAALLVVDVDAGDVGGQQVRRELDAAEGAVDGPRDRLGEHRLADAGHVLDQQVPFGDQTHEREANLVLLSLDDPLHVLGDRAEGGCEPLPVSPFSASFHRTSGLVEQPELPNLTRVYALRHRVVSDSGSRTGARDARRAPRSKEKREDGSAPALHTSRRPARPLCSCVPNPRVWYGFGIGRPSFLRRVRVAPSSLPRITRV